MHAFKTRVETGRIKLDEPTDLPNGTEVVVVPVDELEDAEERAEFLRSVVDGLADVDAGRVHDFREMLAGLGNHG